MPDEASSSELRPIEISFSPEDDTVDWEVLGLAMSEGLNRPYELRLELGSDNFAAEPAQLLGTSVSVTIERGELCNTIHGIVMSVEERAPAHERIRPTVTIVPALMALDQGKHSRIFQGKSVKEILQEVLEEGLGPFEREVDMGYLAAEYSEQEYTVQYRESNLAFVERLMEENGIGYLFTHEGGTEKLVLFDSDAAFADLVSFGNADGVLPVVLRDTQTATREDAREFSRTSQLRSTVARTLVFDWLAPSKLHEVENAEALEIDTADGATLGPARVDYEHDEPTISSGYRTEGLDYGAVEAHVKQRRDLHNRDAVRCKATSSAVMLRPGATFELFGHPQPELDAEYFVVSVIHTAGALSPTGAKYANEFECLPGAVQWRPDRRRARPRIPSVQTATVVGPAGEEIHTDEHGRIMIQLHWEPGGTRDENSSCFVRVVQPWAGAGWGSMFLPRIGMEVAVTFIDGDPERPVVTGCVYNGDNKPPYPLPDEKTKSTLKSNSSPGGGGFNELRFEDAAGSEEVFLHAQKDFNEVVLNDHNTEIGNDQTNKVKNNQTEEIDVDQEMTVGGNRTVHVVGDFDETIDGTETRTVTGDVTETFSANEDRTISGNQTENVTGNVTRNITGNADDTITGKLSQTVTGGLSVTTPATYEVTAAAGITMTAPAGVKIMAPGGFTLLAPGGTTTIDSFFESHGGHNGSAFASQVGIAGNKVDITGLANGATGIKNEVCGVSLSVTGVSESNSPIDLKTAGTRMRNGAIGLYMLGLVSIN